MLNIEVHRLSPNFKMRPSGNVLGLGSSSLEVAVQVGSSGPVAIAEAYPRILRYIRTMVRDPMEAEDLTQETFLRAYRGRAALRDPQAHLAWLYRIATHVFLDRLRQRTRRPAESETPLEEMDLPDTSPSLQHVAEQGEMSTCVRAHLADLPDSYRAVLLLHDEYQLTGPQVAKVLGISLATVKIRLHRGRRNLKAVLEAG